MNLGPEEVMEVGLYPERPGELDCSYYIRTGFCKFGMTCKFNHPPNRKLAVAAVRSRGLYPERPGQPECQYYLKTGTCKFGATCKFHHPSIAGRVQLNSLGYPLRPNEQECTYYLRTGMCKFGSACKFHHPQSSAMPSARGSLIYSNVHSPTSSGQQSYTGLTNWPLSRPSFIASPRWQSPSSFTQLILPQGLVQVPGWNAYTGQMGSVPSENQQGSNQGPFSSFRTSSVSMGQYRQQRESIFPERPGEPECQFYMKTGDCKFGATCKFHHPRERAVPIPDCMLSPLGLPLRPGEPLCLFYSRYGICKFGPNCKFDHPYGTYAYGYSPSAEVPAAHHSFGSSSGNGERSTEAGPGKSRRVLLAEPQQMAAVDRGSLMDGSHSTASAGPVSSFS